MKIPKTKIKRTHLDKRNSRTRKREKPQKLAQFIFERCLPAENPNKTAPTDRNEMSEKSGKKRKDTAFIAKDTDRKRRRL